MRLAKIRYVIPAFLALAIAAFLAPAGLTPVRDQTPTTPTTGAITVANHPGPQGDYLEAGDHIWFKVRVNQALEPIAVTPDAQTGTYFYFRYTNTSTIETTSNNPHAKGGYNPRKANLHGMGQDGAGYYLLYRHTVAKGISTGATGKLYYVGGTPAVHDSLKNAGGAKLIFSPPAADSEIGGTIKVAAGGFYSTSGRTDPNVANRLEDTKIINPPADGNYLPGDVIILRAEFSRRLTPKRPTIRADTPTICKSCSGPTTPTAGIYRTTKRVRRSATPYCTG